MMREPYVAGQFYPAAKEALIKQLEEMIPKTKGLEKIDAIGAVLPHAGYIYSGAVAGEVYGQLKPKKTYIILSPNHTGYGSNFAASDQPWRTPLGVIKINEELLQEMLQGSKLIKVDALAHEFEHSVEVQLPFIQKLSQDANIVPITIKHGRLPELEEVASAISSAIKKTAIDSVIIASSDMTHYESRESASSKDKRAIEKVLKLDAEGLLEVVEKHNISMCGYMPTTVMILCAKKMNAKNVKLVKYTDSGEATGDIDQVVGYAGIIVY